MDNNELIKKGITGTGMFSSGDNAEDVTKNDVDELHALEQLGSNIESGSNKKINFELHKAGTRGHADHGWLKSSQSFSFADYYNPDRMHFGVLRVLNDDWVGPSGGFGTHPHDNMEIISIPLDGDLLHKDNMGNEAVIKAGDIQVMSAGTGIFHSEYNKNADRAATFLQIWVFPNKRNVTPRYDQVTLNIAERRNKLQQIISPNADEEGLMIQQDAWFSMGDFDKDFSGNYNIKKSGNGVYAFVIKGAVTIEGVELNERDGLGIWNADAISFTANTQDAELLLMDVPMSL